MPHGPLDHRYRGEHPVRTLLYLYREDRFRLALGAAAFFVKHSPTWLTPVVTAHVVDVVVEHRPVAGIWVGSGLLLLVLALNYPFAILYTRWWYGSARRLGMRMRYALSRRMQQLSIGFHARVSAGVLQTKVIRDVEGIETSTQQVGDQGLAALATLGGALAVISFGAPAFLPVFLLVVPAASVLVMWLRGRLRAYNESFRQEVERLSSRVGEMTTLIPITRAHGLERTALTRMDGTLRQVFHAGMRLDGLNVRFGALAWILLNALGVGCLAGAALAAYRGWLAVTPGDVVMLSAYFASLTGAVTTLMSLTPLISRGLESVRSLGEVLEAPDVEHNEGKARVDAVRGHVRFEGVGYSYPGSPRGSVTDFTLDVRPGETVALVGASGAGKSTALNLVIGFLRPTEGRILLDGADLEDLDLRSYRRFLSVVPQESVLFEGTIRDNVTYGLEDVSEDALRRALADANALEFVDRLPGGLDTVVGDRGARLSGGQKQRLAIARALVRDPRVLVLDEATSALDNRSEALVQEALARLVRGRTVFVVAHRLSTIRNADRIVVMEDGRIAEVGSHDELLRSGGLYAAQARSA
ncbi:ABC transporter ATP-binding protein [Saccharothrix syringae]|uniref:ABC transporter ATP-binding protein n=1 Tax=Saccharothrix syringae TaxID=103733 RepID=A0A5Q0GRH5_SACSY|nr:ABC transporter ATP-binding protein [Saccharothrix syringae]QFZ16110.1 ABC transporter ATP-binding protein [Saccharothrix syringae]